MSDHIQYLFKYKKLCLPLELHPLMSSRMCFILELQAVIGHQESVSKICPGQMYAWGCTQKQISVPTSTGSIFTALQNPHVILQQSKSGLKPILKF